MLFNIMYVTQVISYVFSMILLKPVVPSQSTWEMLQFRFLNHTKKKKKFRNDEVIAKTKLIQNMENPKSQEVLELFLWNS